MLPALGIGVVLLGLSVLILYISIRFFPNLVETYYSPVFYPGEQRSYLFFLHPFILALALAWFWDRFKSLFQGPGLLRGIELGIVYVLVATLPSMWITFSAIDVSLTTVLMWCLYGLLQATVAGVLLARWAP